VSELLAVLGPFLLGRGLFPDGKEAPFLGDNPSILQHTDQRCMSDRVTEDGCSGRHVQHGHVRGGVYLGRHGGIPGWYLGRHIAHYLSSQRGPGRQKRLFSPFSEGSWEAR